MNVKKLKEGQSVYSNGKTMVILEINSDSIVVTNKNCTYIETWYFDRNSNVYEENGEYFINCKVR